MSIEISTKKDSFRSFSSSIESFDIQEDLNDRIEKRNQNLLTQIKNYHSTKSFSTRVSLRIRNHFVEITLEMLLRLEHDYLELYQRILTSKTSISASRDLSHIFVNRFQEYRQLVDELFVIEIQKLRLDFDLTDLSKKKKKTSQILELFVSFSVAQSVNMININISEFWSTLKKDSHRFLRIIELNFLSQTQFTESDLNAVKCLVMNDKCKSVAESWVLKQKKYRQKNWNALKISFLIRFSIQNQIDTMKKTLIHLFKLKQNKRSYEEYFDEVKEIERDLSIELAITISNRLVQNLDNDILKMLVEEIIEQSTIVIRNIKKTSNLEQTIRIIKEALRNMNKKNAFNSRELKKYHDLKFSDRTIAEVLKHSFKVMNDVVKNNVKIMKNMINKIMFEQRNNNRNQNRNQNSRDIMRLYRNNYDSQISISIDAWSSQDQQQQRENSNQNNDDYQFTTDEQGTRFFQSTQVICFNCVQSRHFSKDCENETASSHVRRRVQKEVQNRMNAIVAAREANEQFDESERLASLDESTESNVTTNEQKRSRWTNFTSFKFFVDWNHRRRSKNLDEWNLSDENTRIAKIFSCDTDTSKCENEVMIIKKETKDAHKRIDEKIEETKTQWEQEFAAFKKIQRNALDQSRQIFVSSSSNSILTNILSRDETSSSISSNEFISVNATTFIDIESISLASLIIIIETQSKKFTKSVRNIKIVTSSLKSRCLKNIFLFDWHEWCNNANVTISLVQLFDMISRARMRMTNVIKIDNSNRKKQVHFLQHVENKDEVDIEKVNVVQNIIANSTTATTSYSHRNLIYKMAQTMTESKNSEWHKILIIKLNIESSLLLTKLDLNFSSTHQNRNSRMSSKNFYIFASVRSRKTQNNQWDIRKILIDLESTLNLISQRVARQIDCLVRENKIMTMIIANDVKVSLSNYIIMKIIVARITRVMQFFVISRKTSYSMILERSWLRDVFAIDYYEIDEYWIKNSKVDYHKLKISDSDSTRAMKTYMKKCVLTESLSRDSISVDDEMLIDMNYIENERANAIISEVKAKTEIENWENEARKDQIIDQNLNSDEKF